MGAASVLRALALAQVHSPPCHAGSASARTGWHTLRTVRVLGTNAKAARNKQPSLTSPQCQVRSGPDPGLRVPLWPRRGLPCEARDHDRGQLPLDLRCQLDQPPEPGCTIPRPRCHCKACCIWPRRIWPRPRRGNFFYLRASPPSPSLKEDTKLASARTCTLFGLHCTTEHHPHSTGLAPRG